MNTMRGQHLRILSPSEEKELAEFIRLVALRPGRIFQDADFRAYAIATWFEKYGNRRDVKRFITSRAFHDKHRPSVTDDQQEQWMNRIEELLRTVAHDRILNTEETSWLLWPRGILTWTEVNSDHAHVLIRFDPKENLTVLATMTASGDCLPLFLLSGGKTERVERSQIRYMTAHWVSHSATGSVAENVFEKYLELLRHPHPDDAELSLLRDSDTSHRTQKVKETAARLTIQLYSIPPGMTETFQPLDRRVFGVLTASAKRLFVQRLNRAPRVICMKSDAAQRLHTARTNLTPTTIEEGWDIYLASQ